MVSICNRNRDMALINGARIIIYSKFETLGQFLKLALILKEDILLEIIESLTKYELNFFYIIQLKIMHVRNLNI